MDGICLGGIFRGRAPSLRVVQRLPLYRTAPTSAIARWTWSGAEGIAFGDALRRLRIAPMVFQLEVLGRVQPVNPGGGRVRIWPGPSAEPERALIGEVRNVRYVGYDGLRVGEAGAHRREGGRRDEMVVVASVQKPRRKGRLSVSCASFYYPVPCRATVRKCSSPLRNGRFRFDSRSWRHTTPILFLPETIHLEGGFFCNAAPDFV